MHLCDSTNNEITKLHQKKEKNSKGRKNNCILNEITYEKSLRFIQNRPVRNRNRKITFFYEPGQL